MKRTLTTVLAGAAVLGLYAAPAVAQLHLNLDTKDPITQLDSATWESLMMREVHAEAAAGDDAILVISSLPVPITITCDKWTIVGDDVYKSVRGNPRRIEPFSVTYVKTKEFDGYCKDGMLGHAGIKTYNGKVDSPDGSFVKSTTVLFSGAR